MNTSTSSNITKLPKCDDNTAAMTAGLTAITHTAPGTPDYAVQDLVNTSAYGFVTKDEGNTVLSVIKNLQTRVAELEALVESLNLIKSN